MTKGKNWTKAGDHPGGKPPTYSSRVADEIDSQLWKYEPMTRAQGERPPNKNAERQKERDEARLAFIKENEDKRTQRVKDRDKRRNEPRRQRARAKKERRENYNALVIRDTDSWDVIVDKLERQRIKESETLIPGSGDPLLPEIE